MKIIVQFSGGKDSLAALLWARNNLSKDITAVFCDTGWEHPVTYAHINSVTEKLKVELVTIKSKAYKGFLDLAKKKKRFPSTKARFCTSELKVKPMIDYIIDEVRDHFITIQGIRMDESYTRSKMGATCNFFRYYTEPYGFDKKGKPRFHNYRKKEVLQFCKYHVSDVLRPVFDWTASQTIDYILSNGIEPNPLYRQGMKRVGCYPCVMANQKEIQMIAKNSPERLGLIKDFEYKTGSSFFPPDKIPKWACKNKNYPTIDDVEKYIKAKNATLDLFGETSCTSYYNICE